MNNQIPLKDRILGAITDAVRDAAAEIIAEEIKEAEKRVRERLTVEANNIAIRAASRISYEEHLNQIQIKITVPDHNSKLR